MKASVTLEELLNQIRNGSNQAAALFYNTFKKELKLIIRSKLTHPLLRRVYDSTDVSQSVLVAFFAKLKGDDYRFQSAEELKKLFHTLVRNKLIDYLRREKAACRDVRCLSKTPIDEHNIPEETRDPVGMTERSEQLESIMAKMSPEIETIALLRCMNLNWSEIGDAFHKSADTIRKRYHRGLVQVRREFFRPSGAQI